MSDSDQSGDDDYNFSASEADPLEEFDDDMDEEEVASGLVQDKVPCDNAVEEFFGEDDDEDEDVKFLPKAPVKSKSKPAATKSKPAAAKSKPAAAKSKPAAVKSKPAKDKPAKTPAKAKVQREPESESESEAEVEADSEPEPEIKSKKSKKSRPKGKGKGDHADKAAHLKEGVSKPRARPSKGGTKNVGKAESARFMKYLQTLGKQKRARIVSGDNVVFSFIKTLPDSQRHQVTDLLRLAFATMIHYGDAEQLRKIVDDPFPELKVTYPWTPAPGELKAKAPNFLPVFRVVFDVLGKPLGLETEPEPMIEEDEM